MAFRKDKNLYKKQSVSAEKPKQTRELMTPEEWDSFCLQRRIRKNMCKQFNRKL